MRSHSDNAEPIVSTEGPSTKNPPNTTTAVNGSIKYILYFLVQFHIKKNTSKMSITYMGGEERIATGQLP